MISPSLLPMSDMQWVGKCALQSCKREAVNHRPHSVYVVSFFAIQTQNSTPVKHGKTRLGGLHASNQRSKLFVVVVSVQNCSTHHTIFHANSIPRGTGIGRNNFKNIARQQSGCLGTRSSKWHYPAGKVESGLQTLAGARG